MGARRRRATGRAGRAGRPRGGPARGHRRASRVALAGALLLPLLMGASGTGGSGDSDADPTLGPLISGTSAYVDGAFVWTDYVYDDRGANEDPLSAGGDASYPEAAEPGNAADLVQLQLDLAPGNRLRIRAVLNSLVDPGLGLLGVGLDTDRDASTGAPDLPGSGWEVAGSLGLEALVTVEDSRARLLRPAGDGWEPVAEWPATVDPATNVMETLVPREVLDPRAGSWNVIGALGLGADGHSWLDGDGPIHDLAFVVEPPPYTESPYAVIDAVHQVVGSDTREWQDHRQAAVLAGQRDASDAVATLDLGRMRRGGTTVPEVARPGISTLLYRSWVDLGEGVRQEPRQYRGRYQPYLVRMPDLDADRLPLLVFLHGLDQNHLQTVNYFERTPADALSDPLSPGTFDVPGVVVFPLGRDPGWNTPASEQDALDVIDDVTARLAIDTDRISLSGISAGGIGTFRIGSRHPDRFAGLYSLVGASTGDDPLVNLGNVPVRMMNGALDPLVNVGLALQTAAALAGADGVDHRAWIVNLRSHFPVSALGNCVYLDFMARERVVDPARVTYQADPGELVDEPERGLQLTYDGAYWLSDLRPRGEQPARADVVTLARSDREPATASLATAHQNMLEGRDFCGENPAVRTGDTWEELGRVVSDGEPAAVTNALHADLEQVGHLALDVGRMSLSSTEPLEVLLEGDGSTRLRLDGSWTGDVSVERDGVPWRRVRAEDGAVTLADDLTTARSYVLRP